MRQKLLDEKENALVSQKLATIDINIDIEREQGFYKIQKQEAEKLSLFFHEMNFNYFLRQMPNSTTTQESQKTNIIENNEDFKALINNLKTKKQLIVSVLVHDENIMHLNPLGVCLNESFIVCGQDISIQEIAKGLTTLFNKGCALISHNSKRVLHTLKNIGVDVKTIAFDTQIASYVLNTEKTSHPLEYLSQEFLNKNIPPLSDLLGKGKNKISLEKLEQGKKANYLLTINHAIRDLNTLFSEDLIKRKLDKLYFDIELPLIKILFDMERCGIGLKIKKLTELKEHVDKRLKTLEKKIYSLSGKQFNINSSKQLSHILFIDLCITPTGKKTQTGYSTNADVLQNLKSKHKIIPEILEYRTLNKLKTTYIDVLPLQVNSSTNRIHPSFGQAVAQTGRLSCSDPNLQNIPIRSPLGKEIRQAFIAKKGFSFICLDYSQIELRIVAHLSQDKTLLNAFDQNQDIHTQTAALIYNCLDEQVTKTMRTCAKAINFGILYGQGAFGLAREIGITTKEASSFIKFYFEKFKGVKRYIDQCIQETKQSQRSLSIMGRERKIPQINSPNHVLKALGQRLAVNSPIQGSQADIIKLAMIDIHQYLESQKDCNLLLQIHDELIFECEDSMLEQKANKLKQLMKNVLTLSIPLDVDTAIAKNLGEC